MGTIVFVLGTYTKIRILGVWKYQRPQNQYVVIFPNPIISMILGFGKYLELMKIFQSKHLHFSPFWVVVVVNVCI